MWPAGDRIDTEPIFPLSHLLFWIWAVMYEWCAGLMRRTPRRLGGGGGGEGGGGGGRVAVEA